MGIETISTGHFNGFRGKTRDVEIGDLLKRTGEALSSASELAWLAGDLPLAEQIEQVMANVSQIACDGRGFADRPAGDSQAAGTAGGQLVKAIMSGSANPTTRSMAVAWFRTCLPGLGLAEARLLLFLLQSPGSFVKPDAMLASLNSKSGDLRVVRVVICRLRKTLRELDLDDALQTTSHGYRMTPEGASHIAEALISLGR